MGRSLGWRKGGGFGPRGSGITAVELSRSFAPFPLRRSKRPAVLSKHFGKEFGRSSLLRQVSPSRHSLQVGGPSGLTAKAITYSLQSLAGDWNSVAGAGFLGDCVRHGRKVE